jgi:hypothetical protein
MLLVGIFLAGAWLAFERSIVGRSVSVPDLGGKPMLDAIRIAHDAGPWSKSRRSGRATMTGRQGLIVAEPEAGSLAKPSGRAGRSFPRREAMKVRPDGAFRRAPRRCAWPRSP